MYSWIIKSKHLIPDPITLVALPEEFSLEAKNDRSKNIIPVRVTYTCNKDVTNLTENWPDYRVPTGYSEEKADFCKKPVHHPSLFWDSENSGNSE